MLERGTHGDSYLKIRDELLNKVLKRKLMLSLAVSMLPVQWRFIHGHLTAERSAMPKLKEIICYPCNIAICNTK